MAYQKLVILAPCHGLEDFPLFHTGQDAASLLACWTSLWHPQLLHHAQSLPCIVRSDYLAEPLEHSLVMLPIASESDLDADLLDRAEECTILQGFHERPALIEAALEPLGGLPEGVDHDLVEDFLAFGFAYLQVELLTQQMRYASSIDLGSIRRSILPAADCWMRNDVEAARTHLHSCFDQLADQRNHYYPVDVFLIDLMPVDQTIGDEAQLRDLAERLGERLESTVPQNVLMSAATLEKLATLAPQVVAALRAAIEAGRVGLVGGEHRELPLPLMTPRTFTDQLESAAEIYRRLVGQAPRTFGRRRSGMFGEMPGLLLDAGLTSAMHFNLDEGRYPESSQSKTTWQSDNGAIDAIGRMPLDAAQHETFLSLPTQLGDTMDTDHVATRVFVHWPGTSTDWYDDFRRASQYGAPLGRFVTVQEYFDETNTSGDTDTFEADQYIYPFLRQVTRAGQADPISRWHRYWQAQAHLISLRGAAEMAQALQNLPPNIELLAIMQKCGELDRVSQDEAEGQTAGDHIADDRDMATESLRIGSDLVTLLSEQLNGQLAAERSGGATSSGACLGLINALPFPVRRLVHQSAAEVGSSSFSGESIYATETLADGSRMTLVDVPAMGFVSLATGGSPGSLAGPDLAEDLMLRNEFLRATIDRQTGALRSLKDYRPRGMRLSQQLGFRDMPPRSGQVWVDRRRKPTYSVMACDEVQITQNGKIVGEITSRGRLLDHHGLVLARFEQRYRLMRGSRVLQIDIQLHPERELSAEASDPWEVYFCNRIAWGDETIPLRVGRRWQSFPAEKQRIEAPLFIELDQSPYRTALLTGGLPYHRRSEPSKLDTLLIVPGEQCREFRLGIGIDLPNCARSSVEFLMNDQVRDSWRWQADAAQAGWLWHVDARNVLITDWRPLADINGCRVTLLETEGRPAETRLRCFRPIRQVRSCSQSLRGEPEPPIAEDAAIVKIDSYQQVELEILW